MSKSPVELLSSLERRAQKVDVLADVDHMVVAVLVEMLRYEDSSPAHPKGTRRGRLRNPRIWGCPRIPVRSFGRESVRPRRV